MVPVFVVPVITMALCDDSVLIPVGVPSYGDYEQFKIPKWCPRGIMRDCIHECIIWNKSWDNLSPVPVAKNQDLSTPTASLLLTKMVSYLRHEKAKLIAYLYGIAEVSTPTETFEILEKFISHGMYSILNYFVEKASTSSYAWHFDVPTPYDNAWSRREHILCLRPVKSKVS